MAVAGEEAILTITVDAKQAKAELASVHEAEAGLGETASRGVEHLQEGMETLHHSTRRITQGLGAMSLVLGEGAAESSKLFKEVSHLGTAFLLGGPLVGGIVAAISAFTFLKEAFNEDAERAKTFEEATTAMGESIRIVGEVRIAALQTRLLEAEAALIHFGETARQIALDEAEAEELINQKKFVSLSDNIDREEIRLVLLEAKAKNALRAGDFGTAEALNEQYETNEKLIAQNKQKLALVQDELTDNFKMVEVQRSLVKKEDDKKDIKAESKEQALERKRVEEHDAFLQRMKEADDKFIDADNRAKIEQAKFDADIEDAELQATLDRKQKEVLDEEAITEKHYDEEIKLREQVTSEAINIGVSASQQLIADFVDGQDHMMERFASTVLKQAGQIVIGHGISALAGGISLAWNPITAPVGLSGIATGLGLIGAGLAMGGTGAAIDHSLAGGAFGQKVPDKAKTSDPGVGRGGGVTHSGGSGGSGSHSPGTTVFEFNYGIMGPSADETARAVADAQRRADGRGFADVRVVTGRGG